LMRAVNAIEVADTHDGGTEVGGYICEFAEDLHSEFKR
jgi:hypothetical protein